MSFMMRYIKIINTSTSMNEAGTKNRFAITMDKHGKKDNINPEDAQSITFLDVQQNTLNTLKEIEVAFRISKNCPGSKTCEDIQCECNHRLHICLAEKSKNTMMTDFEKLAHRVYVKFCETHDIIPTPWLELPNNAQKLWLGIVSTVEENVLQKQISDSEKD